MFTIEARKGGADPLGHADEAVAVEELPAKLLLGRIDQVFANCSQVRSNLRRGYLVEAAGTALPEEGPILSKNPRCAVELTGLAFVVLDGYPVILDQPGQSSSKVCLHLAPDTLDTAGARIEADRARNQNRTFNLDDLIESLRNSTRIAITGIGKAVLFPGRIGFEIRRGA